MGQMSSNHNTQCPLIRVKGLALRMKEYALNHGSSRDPSISQGMFPKYGIFADFLGSWFLNSQRKFLIADGFHSGMYTKTGAICSQ